MFYRKSMDVLSSSNAIIQEPSLNENLREKQQYSDDRWLAWAAGGCLLLYMHASGNHVTKFYWDHALGKCSHYILKGTLLQIVASPQLSCDIYIKLLIVLVSNSYAHSSILRIFYYILTSIQPTFEINLYQLSKKKNIYIAEK